MRDLGIAPVEQRHLEADFIASLARLAGNAVTVVAGLQHVDDPRGAGQAERGGQPGHFRPAGTDIQPFGQRPGFEVAGLLQRRRQVGQAFGQGERSEEHTSELQSLMRISYAVFCLKKKNINKYNYLTSTSHTTKKQL